MAKLQIGSVVATPEGYKKIDKTSEGFILEHMGNLEKTKAYKSIEELIKNEALNSLTDAFKSADKEDLVDDDGSLGEIEEVEIKQKPKNTHKAPAKKED